jgi:AcrR family transcriptional regulator
MPKIVNKEQMKEDILKASLSAFLKYGFHKATMEKIAKEAGIAKGTLYLYFSSKEELTQSISRAHFAKLKKRLIPKEEFKTLDSLLSHVEQALMISDEDTQFIPIFFEAFSPSFHTASFIDEYEEFFEEIADFYRENFKILIELEAIDSTINPQALGRVFVSMIDGIVLHKGFFRLEKMAYESMVKEAVKMFGKGVV